MDIFDTSTYSFIESVQQVSEELVIGEDDQDYNEPIETDQDNEEYESNHQGDGDGLVDDMSDEDIELIATLY
ncbi:MAG: hypothetical protein ACRC7S_10335 [Cetobacterium sp.]